MLFVFSVASISAADSWLQKSSLPAQPRVGAIAFSIDGFGYVGTGLDTAGNLLNDFWKYDPVNDSWAQAASFPGTGRKNAVAFVTDSFAFAGTGYDNNGLTNDFFKYDPQNNSWLQIEDLDSAGAVYPRRDAAAFSIGNRGYVVGGYDGTSFYSKDCWQYDGSRDTVWNEQAFFPLAGRRWAASFSVNGHGFVGMGYNYSQEYFHDFWKYDESTNTWTQMADYAGNKRGYAVSFVINGFAFVGTGFDGALRSDFYIYDELFNQWAPIAEFGGQPTSSATGFSVNGKGYIFGGVDTLGFKNELWEYTPDNTLGIEMSAGNNELEVFLTPNPAFHSFNIENLKFDAEKIYVLKLYSSTGSLMLSEFLSSVEKTIVVEHFPAGMYYFSVTSKTGDNQVVTGKVILQ
ncbi:hypothetical protein BH11BAC1_BH11BAC1_20210 [soil metagenome]